MITGRKLAYFFTPTLILPLKGEEFIGLAWDE
jgi:hypothetical protein